MSRLAGPCMVWPLYSSPYYYVESPSSTDFGLWIDHYHHYNYHYHHYHCATKTATTTATTDATTITTAAHAAATTAASPAATTRTKNLRVHYT